MDESARTNGTWLSPFEDPEGPPRPYDPGRGVAPTMAGNAELRAPEDPARGPTVFRHDENIDHEATQRAVEAGMDTIIMKPSAPPLPYPDLPATHPANVHALAQQQAQPQVDTRVRLDLASGAKPIDGFEGVDMYAAVKHRVNLLKFPWPWATSSVDEMHCSHFIEHIPMVYWFPGCDDYSPVPRDERDRDLWCLFFDEAWRVLKPGGVFTVIWPALQSVRAFQDPTHRRFLPLESMAYLQKGYREANGLQHYLGICDFDIDGTRTSHSFTGVEPGRSDEAILGLITRCWNIATDTKCTLIAKK